MHTAFTAPDLDLEATFSFPLAETSLDWVPVVDQAEGYPQWLSAASELLNSA